MSQKQKRIELVMPGNRWVMASDVWDATFSKKATAYRRAQVERELRTLAASGDVQVRQQPRCKVEYRLTSRQSLQTREQAETIASALREVRR